MNFVQFQQVYPEMAHFPDWARGGAAVVSAAVQAVPNGGDLNLLSNVTTALFNGTVH